MTDDELNEIAKSASGWSEENITAEMVADGSYRSSIDAISPLMLVNEKHHTDFICLWAERQDCSGRNQVQAV